MSSREHANQPRKPAGAPAGGQWAPMAHAEADISPPLFGKIKDTGGKTKEGQRDLGRAKNSNQLPEYERRSRELAAQLAKIGLIYSGSITRRYTRCGTPGGKCYADPPNCMAPTTSGPPRRTARPSPGGSAQPRPSSTKSGSTTTASYDASSSRCAS